MFIVKDNIKQILSKLPDSPGIYMMKDNLNNIIYIGKAKNLKNRVTSYFRGFSSHPQKTQTLVVNISDIEYTVVYSEEEALLLEANLIKKHLPKFNIRLKDDKSYPFIKITDEDFPRVIKVRKKDNDKARYFGPYTSDYAANTLVEIIHEMYMIRTCNRDMNKISRPCLNFHIKRCMAPCQYKGIKRQYAEMVSQIQLLLTGKQDALLELLQKGMEDAAANLEFEKAIAFRNRLSSIKYLKEKQNIVNAKSDTNIDIIALQEYDENYIFTVLSIRDGKLLDKDHHVFDKDLVENMDELMDRFVIDYYSESQIIPEEILLSENYASEQFLSEAISTIKGRKVKALVPKIGDKKKLVLLALKNGEEYISKHLEKESRHRAMVQSVTTQLSESIGVDSISRIEAYDISNLYGDSNVGVMVVYENGRKVPKDYRKFKIRELQGQDDVRSMAQVIARRFSKVFEGGADSFSKYPSLILIDGGANQVNFSIKELEKLGLEIPIAGLVKNDRHETDAIYCAGETIKLEKRSTLYRFLYEVQEEVHRFAIDYHRTLRSKKVRVSRLDDISGVGPVKKKMLLEKFGSIDEIKKASIAQLTKIKGIDEKLAKEILKELESK